MRTLTHDEARAAYDRVGARQDTQSWYEDAAVDVLIAHGGLEDATLVLDVGCGTGRLAERVLEAGAERVLASDPSPVMVGLARTRLAPYGDRSSVLEAFGVPHIEDGSASHVISTYVLDLLSHDDARRFVLDAHRALEVGGRLCIASLSAGSGPASRAVSAAWHAVWRIRPTLVGGCRPVEVAPLLDSALWEITHRERVSPWGVPSEAIVARRR